MRELRLQTEARACHARALRNLVDVFAIKIWIFKVEKSKCWIQASLTCVRQKNRFLLCTSRINLPMLKFFSLSPLSLHKSTTTRHRNKSLGLLSSVTANFIHSSCSPFRRDVPSTDMNNEWVFGTRMCLPKCASSCSIHSIFYSLFCSRLRSESFAISDNLKANIDIKIAWNRCPSSIKLKNSWPEAKAIRTLRLFPSSGWAVTGTNRKKKGA